MIYRFNDIVDGRRAGGPNYNPDTCSNITRCGHGTFWYSDFYAGGSIRMHVKAYTPNWITREFLWLAFDYPFNQLGVPKALGTVQGDNYFASNFARKLGFRLVTEVPEVFPNRIPLLILEMNKSDCKWLDYSPRTIKSNEQRQQCTGSPGL